MKIDRLYAITVYLLNHGKTSASELAKIFDCDIADFLPRPHQAENSLKEYREYIAESKRKAKEEREAKAKTKKKQAGESAPADRAFRDTRYLTPIPFAGEDLFITEQQKRVK